MTFPDLHHRMCCDECDVMRDRLPDYLAAVEALDRLTNEAARAVTEPRRFHENEDDRQQALGRVIAVARAALARLRDEVPA